MSINRNKPSGSAHQPQTYFAPAGRSDIAELTRAHAIIEEESLFSLLRESIDGYLMILSPQRELLAANDELLEILDVDNGATLLGMRPGEVLNCVHAHDGPDGCGTGRACRTCGGVRAILESQASGVSSVRECLLTLGQGQHTASAEFRVRATPVRVCGYEFIVVVYTDVSGDKRREALEHTFFHDILNTIGGLLGWSKILHRRKHDNPEEIASHILELSKQLAAEVEDHRKLLQAEQGALTLAEESTTVEALFSMLEPVFDMHAVAHGRRLVIESPPIPEVITTDVALLLRVLTNMVKNAFEAIEKGEMVRVWFERRGSDAVFLVHNTGFIPEDVALRIFQRSFSTKAKEGRGIGTYSMKLFGEQYLRGKVDFETDELTGTTFSIRLPNNTEPRHVDYSTDVEADRISE